MFTPGPLSPLRNLKPTIPSRHGVNTPHLYHHRTIVQQQPPYSSKKCVEQKRAVFHLVSVLLHSTCATAKCEAFVIAAPISAWVF